ncbi:MAG: hypothetical protein AAFW84_33700 [Cyanobacteria bacterium J06635_15]
MRWPLWKKSASQELLHAVKIALKKYGYRCNLATRVRLKQVSQRSDLSGETITSKSTYLIHRQGAVVYLLDTSCFKGEGYFVFKALGATECLMIKNSDDIETLEAELLADNVLGVLNEVGLLKDSRKGSQD